MYVYMQCDPGVWTVGFFTPHGEWVPETDHTTPEIAARRVAWLNGGHTVMLKPEPVHIHQTLAIPRQKETPDATA